LAQAAAVRQLAVEAALERQAEVPAPSARRVEAHPRPAQAALVSHPSWVRRAAEPAALRQVREAGVVASKVAAAAAAAARPTSARRAGWVQVWALPRWAPAGCGGGAAAPGGGGGAAGAPQVAWPDLACAAAGWSQLGAPPGGATTVGATGLGACAAAGGAQVVAIPAG